MLRRNVEANGLSGVEIRHAALGGQDGTVPFFEDPDDPATFRMSTRAERIRGGETSVEAASLRCHPRHVDLVKLDVERDEDDVLEDLMVSGAISRVEQLLVEYHHHLDGGRDFLGTFLERLRDHGFRYQVSAQSPGLQSQCARAEAFQDVLVHAFRP